MSRWDTTARDRISPWWLARSWYSITTWIILAVAGFFLVICFIWGLIDPYRFTFFNTKIVGVLAVLIWTALIFPIGYAASSILFIFVSVLPTYVIRIFSKKKEKNALTKDEAIKCKIVLACEGLPDIPDDKPYFGAKEWKKMKHREYKIYRSIMHYNFAEINCSALGMSPKEAFYGLISNHKIRGRYRIFSPFIKEGNHFILIDKKQIKGFDCINVIKNTDKIEKIISTPYFKKNGYLHHAQAQTGRASHSKIEKLY